MKAGVHRTLGIALVASLASLTCWDIQQQLSTSADYSRIHSQRGSDFSMLVQEGGAGVGRPFKTISDRAHQRTHYQTLKAFKESIGETWKATVQVLVKNRQVALGAIVHPDGWILTKSSEVPDQSEVKLADGSKAVATVRERRNDSDLALLKVERSKLPSLRFDDAQDIPVGGWLISTDSRSTPLTIGVLSVSNRNVRSEKAVLGVRLGIPGGNAKGAVVESVVDGGGADRAGIEIGDIIQTIDGKAFSTRDEVLDHLRSLAAGQRVDLGILRNERELAIRAQMMDLANSLFDSTEMEVNGEISARATGFRNVMQHDTVLLPNQCGGPLVDVEGHVVGLNIARSGRVSSLAFHSKNIVPVLNDMLSSAGGPINSQPELDSSAVITASANSIPSSVPTAIQVEVLKPDIQLPK